jgi:hypothetical protein
VEIHEFLQCRRKKSPTATPTLLKYLPRRDDYFKKKLLLPRCHRHGGSTTTDTSMV